MSGRSPFRVLTFLGKSQRRKLEDLRRAANDAVVPSAKEITERLIDTAHNDLPPKAEAATPDVAPDEQVDTAGDGTGGK